MKFIVILLLLIVILLTIAFYLKPKEEKQGKDEIEKFAETKSSENKTKNAPEEKETKTTEPADNETQINETINETVSDEEETKVIPLPSVVRGVDLKDDAGGYYCNETRNPKHQIRLYTYKIIEGIKVLSENYIESEKVENVCDNYPQINISTENIYYNIKWSWDSVEGIDGYRIYQYYYVEDDNITRDYDYYVELTSQAIQFIDEGPDLWWRV